MASWKQYGGIKQIKSASINVTNISVDDILLRKAYSGNFKINGSIIVSIDAQISGNLFINGHSSLQDVSMNNLSVSSTAIFNGNVYTKQTLNTNSIISNTIATSGNVNVGSQLFLNTPHYFYGDVSGIGLDTMNPKSTFDINSNIVSALNVNTTSGTNKNILACNSSQNGIVLGANGSQSTIDFFTNGDISSNSNSIGDSYIYANNDGSLRMHCQNTTHVLSNMLITGPDVNNDTNHNIVQSLTVYDNPGTMNYFPNIYNNNINFGQNAAFRASIPNTSVTSLSLIDNSSCGAVVVGGSYPLNNTKSMFSCGVLDKNGNYMPTETTVYGSSSNTKYLATTGINTYTPRVNDYVLDINGPVCFDNGDIVNVNNTNFEILHMTHAIDPRYNNYIMAVGASTDISGQYAYGYRYSVLYSSNAGATWNSSTLYSTSESYNNNNVLYGTNSIINQIEVYDCSYAFISGNNGTLAYTYNGGQTWQTINMIIQNNSDNETAHYNVKSLKVKPKNNNFSTANTISVYVSVDPSNNSYSYTNTFDSSKSSYLTFTKPSNTSVSYFTTFDVSYTSMNGNVVSKNINLYNSYSSPTVVNSIGVSNNKLYLAGTRIISYNLSNLTTPTLISDPLSNYSLNSSTINYYMWSKIYVCSDTSATVIANGINNAYDGTYYHDIQTSMITIVRNNTTTNWDSFHTDFFKTTIQYIYQDAPSVIVYIPMQCMIKDVYVYDNNNSIVVGYCAQLTGIGGTITNTHVNGSFILVTYDGGITWNDMSTHYLNASGKINLLIGSQLYPNTICIPDPNTLLFSYSTQFSGLNLSRNYPYYIASIATGKTTIYSCFSPNYLNSVNNQLIDICGNMSVYGSLFAKNLTYVTSSSLSDYRIKNDISSIDSYTIDNLNPIQYRNLLTGKSDFGFLAHELQEEIPLLVEGEKDGAKYQSINYVSLIPLLVKEIQNLKKIIEDGKDGRW